MPPTKKLSSRYLEAIDSGGADPVPNKLQQNQPKDDGLNASAVSLDSIGVEDYSYPGNTKFEAEAKGRAMQQHMALEQQESKLSDKARRALLKRRLLEERRTIRTEHATKIQCFVRGALCRHRVGIMVAELIEQLQVEAELQNSEARLLPFDEPEEEDISIDEELYKEYLKATSGRAGEDDDDGGDEDSAFQSSGEVIDGLRFPASLHEINLDDLSLDDEDDMDGESFGDGDDGHDEEDEPGAIPPVSSSTLQQKNLATVAAADVPTSSIADRVGRFNKPKPSWTPPKETHPESPFTWSRRKADIKGIEFTSGSPLVTEPKQAKQLSAKETKKISMPSWLSPTPAAANQEVGKVVKPVTDIGGGSGHGSVKAAASIFDTKKTSQPLAPTKPTKTWKPPPRPPGAGTSKEKATNNDSTGSLSIGSLSVGSLDQVLPVKDSVDNAMPATSTIPQSTPVVSSATLSESPAEVKERRKPSSIADRVKRFNVKQEEKEVSELAGKFSSRASSRKQFETSVTSSLDSSFSDVRNTFFAPPETAVESEEQPKQCNAFGSSFNSSFSDVRNAFVKPEAAATEEPLKQKSSIKILDIKSVGAARSKSEASSADKESTAMKGNNQQQSTAVTREMKKTNNNTASADEANKAEDEINLSPAITETDGSEPELVISNIDNSVASARAKFEVAQTEETLIAVGRGKGAAESTFKKKEVATIDDSVDGAMEETIKDADDDYYDPEGEDDEATAPETVDDDYGANYDDDSTVEEMFHNFSAIQIQALVRGFLVRSNDESKKEEDSDAEEESSEAATDSNSSVKDPIRSLSVKRNAFSGKSDSEEHRPKLSSSGGDASKKLQARREKTNRAAIKIQSLVRGFLTRKVDYGAMVTVIDLLEAYKPIEGDADPVDEQFAEAVSDWVDNVAKGAAKANELPKELSTEAKIFAAQQERQARAATKIQALGRGYIHRKFDTKSVMDTVKWLENIHEENSPPEPLEPKVKKLEKAWAFLEENNAPRKKPPTRMERKRGKTQKEAPAEEKSRPKVNVKKLLGTWEWLKAADNRVKQEPKRTKPSAEPTLKSTNETEKAIESAGPSPASRPKISELVQFYGWLESKNLSSGVSWTEKEQINSLRRQGYEDTHGGVSSESAPEKMKFQSSSGVGESIPGKPSVAGKVSVGSNQQTDSKDIGLCSAKNRKFKSLVSLWGFLERNDMDMNRFRKTTRMSHEEYLEEDMPCTLRGDVSEHRSGDDAKYLDKDESGVNKDVGEMKFVETWRYDEQRKGDGVQYLDKGASGVYKVGRNHMRYKEEQRNDDVQLLEDEAYLGPAWKKPEQRAFSDCKYEDPTKGDGVEYLDDEPYDHPQTWKKPQQPGQRFSDRKYEETMKGDGVQYLDDEPYDHPQTWKKPQQPGQRFSDRKYEEPMKDDGVQYLDDEDGSKAYSRPSWKKPEHPKSSGQKHEEPMKGDGVQYLNDEDGSKACRGDWKKPEHPMSSGRKYDDALAGDGVQYLVDGAAAKVYSGPTWKKPEKPSFSDRKYSEPMKGDGVQYMDENGSKVYGGSKAYSSHTWKKPEKPTFSSRMYEEPMKGDGVQYLDDSSSDASGAPFWKKPEHPGDRFAGRRYDEPMQGDGVHYLDEDESGSDPFSKPTMEDMVNYYNFSAEHDNEHDFNDKDDHGDSEKTTRASNEKSELALKKWVEDPSKNDLLSTLSWLDKQGLDLEDVKADGVTESEEELISPVNDPSSTDMLEMMGWLNKQGLCKADGKGTVTVPSVESTSDGASITTTIVSDVPKKAGAPEASDIAAALGWLERRGFDSKPNSNSSKPSESSGDTAEGQKVDSADSKNVLYELSWLKKHGFDLDRASKYGTDSTTVTTTAKPVENSEAPSPAEMMNALSFLQTRSAKKSEASSRTVYKSPSKETAEAVEWLEKRGVGHLSDGSTTNDNEKSSTQSRSKNDQGTKSSKSNLSSSEMESALNWLQRKGFSTNKPKKPTIPSARTMENAVRLAKSKPSSAKYKRPSVAEMEEALAFAKMHNIPKPRHKKREEKPDDDDGMPSWKKKLLNAKKKILAEDGEQRPDWLQKRVDIVNRKSRPLFSAKPSPPTSGDEATVTSSSTDSKSPQNTKTKKLHTHEKEKNKKKPKKDMKKAESEKAIKPKKEAKKKDITKTLNWLQNKASNPSISPQKKAKPSVQSLYSPTVSSPNKKPKKPRKLMTQAEIDYESALTWLTTKRADSIDDIKYFKKLDSILPKRGNQSPEARAKQMAKAMKWVKKQEEEKKAAEKHQSVDFTESERSKTKSADFSESERSQAKSVDFGGSERPKTRGNSTKKATRKASANGEDLLKGASKPNISIAPTSKKPSKKTQSNSSQRKPPKKSNSESSGKKLQTANIKEAKLTKSKNKSRTKVSEKLSQKEPRKIDEGDGRNFPESEKPNPVVNDLSKLSPGEIDVHNAITWLTDKQNDSLPDAVYFKKLDSMLPSKPEQTEEGRAKDMAKALRWVKKSSARQNSAKAEKDQRPSIKGKPGNGGSETPVQSEVDVKNALAWLASRGDTGLEDAKYFKKLDSMIPSKSGHTNEQRAKELAKALHWVKKTSGKREEDEKPYGFHSSNKPVTPEKTAKRNVASLSILQDRDTASALKWLNNEGSGNPVDDANFRKLDDMMPFKPGQSNEDRAVEMSKALKLLRKREANGGKRMANATGQSGSSSSSKTGQPRKELTRTEQIDNAAKFLNAAADGTDISQLEDVEYFKKLDNMLPKKAGQTKDERAQEMVKMLGWLKKKGKMK